ncbi:MAG: TetR/AcrR family transcriptional regulator [Candidatus Dormibacteraeota bacterium]|uniref:TetR/AcrR family transcriptional regulator n=1 Tax=Candidatus Aeolococcus gillhamiae TaxID=3127015 RepID=A0A2W6AQX6_9BACT|nr:TetR/AcrR family transcriptional regulator [Candidatus Dormibacteraeota bacterium]PZR80211.1 MAG: hypothetical protein DLM65_08725 [Candidatus Dormibacter sp. RRmetagenome_bin12]
MVEAATRLFIRDGYVSTTVGAIASEAGVAVQSLYVGFGSKLGVLSAAFDIAIVGDTRPIPLLDRDWWKELAAAPTGPHALQIFVNEVCGILARTQGLYAVIRAAAASEVGELLVENKRQRYDGVRAVATQLRSKPGFAPEIGIDVAADLLYALATEDSWGLLVGDRGWSSETWNRWCVTLLSSTLFPGGQDHL